MRLTIATAAVAAAAAATVFIGFGPAAAAPSSTSGTAAGTASSSQFQTVAVGQTVQQVELEMGSAQPHAALPHSVPGSNDFSESWKSTSLSGQLGLETFFVDFSAQGSQTPTVTSKGTEPLNLAGL